MGLFAGTIGTSKDPPGHWQVDYDDPTEASEIVLLARERIVAMIDQRPPGGQGS